MDRQPGLSLAETSVIAAVPLHRRPAAISSRENWPVTLPNRIFDLTARKANIPHADFFTIINERSASHCQQ